MPDPNKVYIPLVSSGQAGAEDGSDAAQGGKRTPTPTRTPTATPSPTASNTPTAAPSPTAMNTPTTAPSPSPTAAPPRTGAPAIYIDLKRCIGCDACSLACKQENNVEFGEVWNRVYGAEKENYPVVKTQVLPMLCHMCASAPCKAKCDSLGHHAIVQRSDGIVYIDAARCTGCKECMAVCRYKAIGFNSQTSKAEKCHFCMHRIDAGLLPACVITCLAVTREFGDYNALRAKHPEAKSMGGGVRILYDNLGDEPERDGSTAGYLSAYECHH